MTRSAIIVEGLSKQYRLGGPAAQGGSLREALMQAMWAPVQRWRALQHGPGAGRDSFWALQDVSFEVERGSVVGIVGRNGAGKSTLLKIVSRITEPTRGQVRLRGRVASLLEVGTGFHPELTGRENIYLNGAILGMRKSEITRKFDQIVAFAEVDRFLDTPVKRYSSGMYVRLAFAVAAHLDPDILLVDEVLAVGDAAFQEKCLGRIQKVSQGEGRTVLFVSHNMGAVARLCDRAIWLDAGSLCADGPAQDVVKRYLALNLAPTGIWKRPANADDSAPVRILSVSAQDSRGATRSTFSGGEAVRLEMVYEVSRPVERCQLCARIVNGQALAVFTTGDSDAQGVPGVTRQPGRYRSGFSIPEGFLPPGPYSVHVCAHQPFIRVLDVHRQTARFEVTNVDALASFDDRAGAVTPLISWDCEPCERLVDAPSAAVTPLQSAGLKEAASL